MLIPNPTMNMPVDRTNSINDAWKPSRSNAQEKDSELNTLIKSVRSVLNRLCSTNFYVIMCEFQSLMERNVNFGLYLSDHIIAMIADKAATEALFSCWYLEMVCATNDFIANASDTDHPFTGVRKTFVEYVIASIEKLRATRPNDQLLNEIKDCSDENQFNIWTAKIPKKSDNILKEVGRNCREYDCMSISTSAATLSTAKITECLDLKTRFINNYCGNCYKKKRRLSKELAVSLTEEPKKIKLQQQYNENVFIYCRKIKGFSRVLGESYVYGMCSVNVIMKYTDIFLNDSEDEIMIDCFGALWIACGKYLQNELDNEDTEAYIKKFRKIAECVPFRLKFMLLDMAENLKTNLWCPRNFLGDVKIIEYIINQISRAKDASKSKSFSFDVDVDSGLQINENEGLFVNRVLNKFGSRRRNLLDVIKSFNELAPKNRTKMVLVFLVCVVRETLYSGECGALLSRLTSTKTIQLSDIINGLREIIKGYLDNVVIADQQIWLHIKNILQILVIDKVLKSENFNLNIKIQVPVKSSREEKKNVQKNPRYKFAGEATGIWQRGVPITSGPPSYSTRKNKRKEGDADGELN